MKRFFRAAALLAGLAGAVVAGLAQEQSTRTGSPSRRVPPAPLFRDPVHDGAADATLIWNRGEQCWWMLYTNRRADADNEKGVQWVHGTDIGLASTPDGGLTWKYRGIARGLEFETNGTRNTFWAPEVVDFGGKYHAFISYVRGVPETWKGTRDILHYTSTNLLNWKFESIVVPGSIDACVHRLPDGRWRMWFKNEQRKLRGTVLDSDDLYTWKPTPSEMPDPDPGKGEGPDVFRWQGAFWMVKDLWRGLGVYRSPDLDHWKFMGVILDQPSVTAALGLLPGPGVDRETMRHTLDWIWERWNWPDTWGWDYPMAAMCAARLGQPERAVDALLLDTPKNRYRANGHNHQRPGLTIYLPGNGGLLSAVAMMAAGWDGSPKKHAPGFPANGQWTVRWENLRPMP